MRILEIILIICLSLFSFFLGVKYSRAVREHASWMFENRGDEVELPDLSNTENPEMDLPVDANGKAIDQANTPPAEDQNIVPSIDEADPADQNVSSQTQDNNSAPKAAPSKQQNKK